MLVPLLLYDIQLDESQNIYPRKDQHTDAPCHKDLAVLVYELPKHPTHLLMLPMKK